MRTAHRPATRTISLAARVFLLLALGAIPVDGAFGQDPARPPASLAPGATPTPPPTPGTVTIPLRLGLPAFPNPTEPTLTLYLLPANAGPRALVVVCPGGGYAGLAAHEGEPIARWLNELGISAVVLRYRHGASNPHPAPLDDAGRAIRLTRHYAGDWGVDPARVAILGFSAGGHLASTAGTHFDAGRPDADDPVERQSSRPDRMVLIYPVVTMRTPETHAGSRRNLLGADPAPALVDSLSNETQVTPKTPPAFIVHTADDSVVPAENSLRLALALQAAHVPVELHLFERGPHGFGLAKRTEPDHPAFAEWAQLCARWLDAQGFTRPGTASPR